MRVLNIHDIGEDGHNQCYEELLEYFPKEQITSPTHNLAEDDPAEIMLHAMLHGPYDLIVGKGFGAILALIIGRSTATKTVLLNPMYPIRRYLPTDLPEYKHGDMLSYYEHDSICWDAKMESLKDVFVILGRDDDVTDTKRTAA